MSEKQKKTPIFVKIVKVLFPLILIAVGGVAMAYFKATAPVIKRTPPQRQVTAVQVESVREQKRTAVSLMVSVLWGSAILGQASAWRN